MKCGKTGVETELLEICATGKLMDSILITGRVGGKSEKRITVEIPCGKFTALTMFSGMNIFMPSVDHPGMPTAILKDDRISENP